MVIDLREIKKEEKTKRKTRVNVCESVSVTIAMKVCYESKKGNE